MTIKSWFRKSFTFWYIRGTFNVFVPSLSKQLVHVNADLLRMHCIVATLNVKTFTLQLTLNVKILCFTLRLGLIREMFLLIISLSWFFSSCLGGGCLFVCFLFFGFFVFVFVFFFWGGGLLVACLFLFLFLFFVLFFVFLFFLFFFFFFFFLGGGGLLKACLCFYHFTHLLKLQTFPVNMHDRSSCSGKCPIYSYLICRMSA